MKRLLCGLWLSVAIMLLSGCGGPIAYYGYDEPAFTTVGFFPDDYYGPGYYPYGYYQSFNDHNSYWHNHFSNNPDYHAPNYIGDHPSMSMPHGGFEGGGGFHGGGGHR